MRRAFTEEVTGPEGAMRVEYAALLIGAEDEAAKEVEVSDYMARLDAWAEGARRVIANRSESVTPVEAFNGFMFEGLGLAGNKSDYYDPRNSYLNEVMERRTGIPITLSILYMAVGRRAGFEVKGVGLPGHFITRIREVESRESTMVDPFHGKIIDRTDCQERLDEIYSGQVALRDEHLRATSTPDILVRVLSNLKTIYARAGLYRQALSAVERILLVKPHAAEELRERGAFLAQLNRLPEAIAYTAAYLQIAPDAPDAKETLEQLKAMRRRHALLS
ncbi:MAG TPA: transglutaminase-like domain-containing protein [Pyrinomonadaceae bacterium]|jgi:regulator of sirC expression with transglutaminase-like and TPR domain